MAKHPLDPAPETPSKRHRSALPARPCDSPSNPFGRKRVRTLAKSLPPPTPFSKHLPLRFQLVRTDRPSPRLHGGLHRVVQVPTNYTFMHLRCLIAFLFGDRRSILLQQGEGHLFDVKRKIHLFSMNYKPGQVKSGQTWAKLSSAKDPCRYRPECNLSGIEGGEEPSAAEKSQTCADGEEEPGEWKWHAEEDFTLERAWPKGCDLARAIVYYHNRTTEVHITINTTPIEKRKGVSNTPYVFIGRGLVSLLQQIIPKPQFSQRPAVQMGCGSVVAQSSPSSLLKLPHQQMSHQEQDSIDQDVEGELDPDTCNDPEGIDPEEANDSDASEDEPDNIHATLNPEYFNYPNAFSGFFSRCQHLARSRLQLGSGFGQEYDLTSSEEDASDAESLAPTTLLASSPASEFPEDYSSPATSLFESLTRVNSSKAREAASSPPQTSSPGPSSPGPSTPVSTPVSNKTSSSSSPRPLSHYRHPASSPVKNVLESRTNLSLKKRRHTSLLHNLPFHPSPSGFPKYTPLPDRGRLYRMRINRIEKRVERMKSLEWLRVPDEDEDNERKKKKEEAKKKKVQEEAEDETRKKKEEELKTLDRLIGGRKGPGGILEMGVRRGKRFLPLTSQSGILMEKPEKEKKEKSLMKLGRGRVSSEWHPFDDEMEV